MRETQKNKKKSKKKKDDIPNSGGLSVPFESGPPPGENSDGEASAGISAPKPGVTVTPDDLADEEWGPLKEKGKKGKKGKVKKEKTEDEDETAGTR